MPFIISKVNVSISNEQELQLKKLLGRAIELIPGKNENYLMAGFEQNYKFYLRGENQPCAFIEVSIFGTEDHVGYDKFTAAVTKILFVMSLLVCNVYELAKIYESEESLGGLPIVMDGFNLFSESEISSLPLNLAYKAAQLADTARADLLFH